MSEENNIGAVLCPGCRKLISSNSEECIHCGMKNPNLWGLAGTLRKIIASQTSLVPIISTVCIALFVISLLLDPSSIFQMSGSFFGFLSPSGASLRALGMTGLVAMIEGRWWTLITAIYLHGGLLHILFNVMWIRQLGPVVEDFFGISRAFVIFTIAGVTGFLFSSYAFIISPSFAVGYTIGASGSIFGLLGALVYYGRRRGGTFGAAVYRQTGQWAIVLFIFGFLFPGVDNFAHAGGFIGGYLSASFFGYTESKPETRTHQLLALGSIAMTILAFLLAFFS